MSMYRGIADVTAVSVAVMLIVAGCAGAAAEPLDRRGLHQFAQAEDYGDTDRAFEINPDAPDLSDGETNRGVPSEDGTPNANRAPPNAPDGNIDPPGCALREGPLELLV